MKSLATGAVLAMSFGLAACAGTPAKSGFVLGSQMDANVDVGKVTAVNQWALKRHATVVWINFPVRSLHPRPSDG